MAPSPITANSASEYIQTMLLLKISYMSLAAAHLSTQNVNVGPKSFWNMSYPSSTRKLMTTQLSKFVQISFSL
jgi:hypothetical protein